MTKAEMKSLPDLHESVTYCKQCNHYVARVEVQPCEVCRQQICPDCARPTPDPDLSVCSALCGAKLQRRLRKEAA